MAYLPNIPQPADRLKDSQPQILANFQELETFLEIDHGDFGSADEGFHVRVTLPPNMAGAPTFPAAWNGLYSAPLGLVNQNEVYVHKYTGSGALSAEIPFTASILSTTSAPAAAAAGWSYLPSGIIMRWGGSNATGSTPITLTGAPFPTFTQMLNIQLVVVNAAGADVNQAIRLVSIDSPTQFTVYASARTTTVNATVAFQYLIMGY